MTIEIELKFAIRPDAAASLPSFLTDYSIILQQHFFLKNCYYDTPNYLLRKNDCGLRVRSIHTLDKSPQYEITLKRRNRSVIGLYNREEFTVSTSDETLNTHLLPPEVWPKILSSCARKAKIIPLFTTHFERDTWLIQYRESQIELAFDKGHIVKEEDRLIIDELELELITGSVYDLLNFASELSSLGLRLLSQSKAARGYRLIKQTKFYPPEYDPDVMGSIHPLPIQKVLKFWQNSEEFAVQQEGILPYVQLKTILNDLACWLDHRPKTDPITHAQSALMQLIALLNQQPRLTQWLYHPNVTQFKLLLQKLLLE